MIKITLLGDSIRMKGYGLKVPNLLGENFEVFQPNENCRFAKYTLRGLFDWESKMSGSQIVHWNNGLWDICNLFGDGLFTPESEYVENMLRIADILIKRYDKVIFATTTPVTMQNQYNSNADIERYNALIVPLLKEKGVIINDLYQLVSSDIDKYISKDDNLHLSDEGIKVCAEQVANTIRKVSQSLNQNVKKEMYSFADDTNFIGAPI